MESRNLILRFTPWDPSFRFAPFRMTIEKGSVPFGRDRKKKARRKFALLCLFLMTAAAGSAVTRALFARFARLRIHTTRPLPLRLASANGTKDFFVVFFYEFFERFFTIRTDIFQNRHKFNPFCAFVYSAFSFYRYARTTRSAPGNTRLSPSRQRLFR